MGCFQSRSGREQELSWSEAKAGGRRRRRPSAALASAARSSELLSCIPGRMCVNGSSRVASLFTQQGRKGTNQDAMIVWENFASQMDSTFCGVFDGHGPFGHLVAKRVRDSLPAKLVLQFKEQLEGVGGKGGTDLQNTDILKAWKDSFLGAYNIMDTELKGHSTIDCFCSGTTAVTLLLQGKDLVIANVGDSRAVLGRRHENNMMEAFQLTVDLKPNLPNEAERIKQCKGRVFALEDEPEVPRVWLPHDNAPGLAMARAFGDFCLKDFGLISVPDIIHYQLTDEDQFIVLATDGIWDVLSNEEAVDAVTSAPTRTTAARALVEAAVRAWRLKYPSSKVDDCAVVCLFLNEQWPSLEAAEHRIRVPSKVLQVTAANASSNRSNAIEVTTVNGPVLPSEDTEGFSLQGTTHSGSGGGGAGVPGQRGEQEGSVEHAKSRSVRPSAEGCGAVREGGRAVGRSQSRGSLAECLSAADDDEWLALEGVTRVNSLLTLPRFLVGDWRAGRGGSSSRPKSR